MLVAMRNRTRTARATAVTTLFVLALSSAARADDGASSFERRAERRARLENMRGEIARLESEVDELRGRERGVLGELERIGAELRLRETEHARVTLELEAVGERLDETRRTLDLLTRRQAERREYLASRLRGLYRTGPDAALKQLLEGDGATDFLAGARYAAYLSSRDARVIGEYREDAERLERERDTLAVSEAELTALSGELETVESELRTSRAERERALAALREDRNRRQAALDELRAAAEAMARLVESFSSSADEPSLDMRKFRGLLDWPADGEVSAGFGSVIHPRFRTRVPHPGLDIEGDFDDSIRCVFDGTVVFASWMRGYGLTLIVDHGGGLLSVYAHASVLLAGVGDRVIRGESLGRIGDSGSLRGSYLYFELRTDGRPVDPVPWFRPRS
jgi:septal ring factor EnvC (AmiA/AmiB activator)